MHKYFKHASDEERDHAMKFMDYQNKRGGTIKLMDVSAPTKQEWTCAKDAMTEALSLEKRVNEVITIFTQFSFSLFNLVSSG